MSEAARHDSFIRDPTNRGVFFARYLAASLIVAGIGGGLVQAYGGRSESVEATDADSAIPVDLSPVLAASQPATEAADGPPQEAAAAAPPVVPPRTADAPSPPIEPLPPNPAAALEPRKEKPEASPPVAAAASPAVVAQAPRGTDASVMANQPDGDEGRPHASARAISAWQRALVGRVEVAKRALRRRAHAVGTVRIAFAVDGAGRLVSSRVARSSGATALDDAALQLVKSAAPFPVPPLGTGARDLSFILPVQFTR